MAQRNRKAKRKLNCCPCLSSGPDEDGSGEQGITSESDEEAKLLGHFENSDDNKENFCKAYYQIKEKSKKHKKEWKAPMNSQNIQLYEDGEATVSLESRSLSKSTSSISSTSVFKKNKNSKSKNLGKHMQSGLECTKPISNEGCQNQAFSLSSLSLSIMEKIAKGKKALLKSSSQDQLPGRYFKRVCKSPRPAKKNKNKVKPLCQHVHAFPSQNPYLNGSDEEQGARISRSGGDGKALGKGKGIQAASCYFEDGILSSFKKHRKPHKGVSGGQARRVKSPETNKCQSRLQPLLSSSPIALEFKTYNSEEEFYTVSLTENRDTPRVKSSPEEMCSSFDQSQDFFLTQRSLLSRHVSDSSSGSLSSPAPKRAKNGSRELNEKPSYSLSNLPQSSSYGETLFNGGAFLENNLKFFEEIRKYSGRKEKAIQTEDFFGSSVLAGSLLFRREVDLCEEPLDLTLPGRSRSWVNSAENVSCTILAAGDGVHIISQNVSETICPMEDQTTGSGLVATVLCDDSQEEKGACSQLRKQEEIKYIQTKLNSPFFFKRKSEPDATILKEPLVKFKNQAKTGSI